MLYGVWSSLQPDHETNKSPRRMLVSPPARNDDRSPIWNIWRPPIFSLPRISTKDFSYIKGKIDRSIGINYSSVNFKWTQVFLCCQSSMRSQRSMNFLKRQVIQDKSKPTRDAMIWLRVEVNGTRLCTAVHFVRNEIKYQKSHGNGLFQYKRTLCMYDCLFVIYMYLYRSINVVINVTRCSLYRNRRKAKKYHSQYLWQKRNLLKLFFNRQEI